MKPSKLADILVRSVDHRRSRAGARCGVGIPPQPRSSQCLVTYVAIAVMVIYGLPAHFDEKTTAS